MASTGADGWRAGPHGAHGTGAIAACLGRPSLPIAISTPKSTNALQAADVCA